MIDFKVLPEALLFIAGAVPNTLFMAFVSIFFGILFGSFIAVLRLGNNMFINIFFAVFVSFFRAVPGIVQLFIVYYSLPYFLAPVFSAFSGTEVKPFDVSPYWSVYLCFILYNTAYQSENIRGALRSVDHGQYEAAVAMGMTPEAAATAVSSVTEVAGRYSVHDVNGRRARMMLAKNPAGWQEAMTMVDPRVDQVVIGVNGQVPDGQDLSWLWDVDFSRVNQPGRRVIACGERGADLAVRLEYAGIHCDLAPLPMDALAACEPGRVEVLLNYTAMRDFKVLLDRKEGKR